MNQNQVDPYVSLCAAFRTIGISMEVEALRQWLKTVWPFLPINLELFVDMLKTWVLDCPHLIERIASVELRMTSVTYNLQCAMTQFVQCIQQSSPEVTLIFQGAWYSGKTPRIRTLMTIPCVFHNVNEYFKSMIEEDLDSLWETRGITKSNIMDVCGAYLPNVLIYVILDFTFIVLE